MDSLLGQRTFCVLCMKQVLQCFIVLFQMLKQSRPECCMCHTILQFYSSQVCSSAPQVTHHHWKSTFFLGQDSINQNLGMEWNGHQPRWSWNGLAFWCFWPSLPSRSTCPNHRPASKRFDHQPRWCPPLETSTCVFSMVHQKKYTRYILILVFFPVGHEIFCVRNIFKNQHVNRDWQLELYEIIHWYCGQRY